MTDVLSPSTVSNKTAVLAISIGGMVAGTLDLLQACISFGWDIPLAIAGGVLGKRAFDGGVGTYILGVALHYFIALSAAAIYYGASRRLVFLRQSWIICGIFFGAAVDDFMRLIVLPLSSLHSHGPYQLQDLLKGLITHSIVVGLPIAYSSMRFGSR